MPELPEVESTRRALVPDLEGQQIVCVTVARDRMVRRHENPSDFKRRLEGRKIIRLRRHGKFMMTDVGVAPDGPEFIWVTHLGMSGRIQVASPDEIRAPHTNVTVGLGSGREFRFIDPRTFGFVAAWTPEELAATSLGDLGPDALTALPRVRQLVAVLAGRSAPIKALLLDQRIVAGVGNIYADESLHRSQISPHRRGGSLSPEEVGALRSGIRASLAAGLKWGGTSLDDLAYLLPDGRAGQFTSRLRAYGREGEGCRRCSGTVRRDVIRGRSSFWCPGCQI
ncbi:MAG: bifunctional DNA-formamidopyrimidine glycosylase/DNA-(apurinic or apyrimidinic site) lyase [bacterium]|nr:bifunctional DNA-formamidopyrimidine glycosylase/DNA-(apurinic or apyrimidinic site) lyase [bacterium]